MKLRAIITRPHESAAKLPVIFVAGWLSCDSIEAPEGTTDASGLVFRGLAQMPRVKVHTPLSSEISAGIICFEVEGVSPEMVVERLKQRKVIASVTPASYEMHLPRLAPSLLTSPAEVEASLRTVREIV